MVDTIQYTLKCSNSIRLKSKLLFGVPFQVRSVVVEWSLLAAKRFLYLFPSGRQLPLRIGQVPVYIFITPIGLRNEAHSISTDKKLSSAQLFFLISPLSA